MNNSLDVYRAQQAVAEALHAELGRVVGLLRQIQTQMDAVAQHQDLRMLLARQEDWLTRSAHVVDQVRRLRELEQVRYWPSIARRWFVALAFALASAAAAGVGYAWFAKPYARELDTLRTLADVGRFLEQRRAAMTPSQRRQLDALLEGPIAPR